MKKLFSKITGKKDYYRIPDLERMQLIEKACNQVSRGVFFSTIIIITSFLPVFLLNIAVNYVCSLSYNFLLRLLKIKTLRLSSIYIVVYIILPSIFIIILEWF